MRSGCPHFRGFDDAPRITPGLTELDRNFLKLEVAGIDGEVLLGPIVLRGEAGYFHYPGGADGIRTLPGRVREWSLGAGA